MRDYLTKVISEKRAKVEELQKRSDESQDLAEVRAIGETLKDLAAEIADAEEQLAKLDEENENSQENDNSVDDNDARNLVPDNAELRNAQVVSSFGGKEIMEENLQYRNAFMEYVLRGTPISAELRQDANTLTTDVTVIPTNLVNQIVEKMELVGSIIGAVTRTAFKGGVQIPTSSVKPVATWVGVSSNLAGEGLSSDRQKKTTVNVTFAYHKLRCEISMSMEVGTMALSAFEAKFVENVAKAMIKAIETAIISGDGTNQPKGILAETPVDGQAITGAISFAKLCECEAALPEEYEADAVWCMTKKDFYKFVAVVDDNGQPIARVNYGIAGKPEYVLLGRPVLVSTQATAGTPFIFNMADYVLNTVYDMGISKKQDWDTEDLLTKAVMSVDGKVVDKNSLVTFAYTPSI